MNRSDLTPEAAAALGRLRARLSSVPKPAVAVSGGVDSMTLAVVTHRVNEAQTRILHAVSPAVPPDATARVHAYAAREGWRLEVLDAEEMADPRYLANPVNRCYFCKTHLYDAMGRRASGTLLSGTNLDDLGDYRPGLIAAEGASRPPPLRGSFHRQARGARHRGLARARRPRRAARGAVPVEPGVETGMPHRGPTSSKRSTIARRRCERCSPRAPCVCRLRRDRIEVELDAGTLERLDETTRTAGAEHVARRFARAGRPLPVVFSAYRRGSAFLHRVGDE